MPTLPSLPWDPAVTLAKDIVQQLREHCDKIVIAGSIRRRELNCGDAEIVCIPKRYNGVPYQGYQDVINKYEKVKGEPAGKYTQRLVPVEGDGGWTFKVDFFTAVPENYGYILAIRTGSVKYSKMLAWEWSKRGYKGVEGYLTLNGERIPVPDEQSLFDICNVAYLPAHLRK